MPGGSPGLPWGLGIRRKVSPTREVFLTFFPTLALLIHFPTGGSCLGKRGKEDVGKQGASSGGGSNPGLWRPLLTPAKESSIAPPRARSVLITPFSKTGLGRPHGPAVKKLLCNAGDTSLIPGRETKIPYAAGQQNLSTITRELPQRNGRSCMTQRRSHVPQRRPNATKWRKKYFKMNQYNQTYWDTPSPPLLKATET